MSTPLYSPEFEDNRKNDYSVTECWLTIRVFFLGFREGRGGEVGDTKLHPDHPPQKEGDFFGGSGFPMKIPLQLFLTGNAIGHPLFQL